MEELQVNTEYYDNENGKIKVTHIDVKHPIKYNICINQKAVIDNKLNVNLTDMAIFNFMYDFINSDSAMKIQIDGVNYHWIAYKYIIDSMPLLEIKNKDVIARHINKLIEAKLLDKIVSKEMGNKTFYKIGVNAKCLYFDTLPTQKLVASDSKVDTLPTQKSYNSYINDTNINYIKKEEDADKSANIPISNLKEKEKKIAVRDNVNLTEKEIEKLKENYASADLEKAYDKLSFYKLSKGKIYKSDYGALNMWVFESLNISKIIKQEQYIPDRRPLL